MVQEFSYSDDLYLIDMSYLNSPSELVYDLTSVLDNEQAKNRRIKIKIGGIDLNQAQLMSINSLIMSINSSLVVLDGTSEITRASALASGIVYENSSDMVPTETAFINEIAATENKEENETPDEPEQSEEQQISEQYVSENSENGDIPSENTETPYYENTNEYHENENTQSENNEIQTYETEKDSNSDNICSEAENNQQYETVQTEEIYTDNTENNNSDSSENYESDENQNEPQQEEEIVVKNYSGLNEQAPIPESSVIQEELTLIYGTEKKLEDVFESTGLKEEKFISFRESAAAEEREYTKFDFELESFPTKYLKQNICTGQVISFDGNLVIIGDCHEGSEISASGDITVWGDLSGSAYAGMNGNEKAKIRALRMNASQLRISTCFIKRPEVLENPNGQKLPLIPEEAGIVKGEIGVYKIFK